MILFLFLRGFSGQALDFGIGLLDLREREGGRGVGGGEGLAGMERERARETRRGGGGSEEVVHTQCHAYQTEPV